MIYLNNHKKMINIIEHKSYLIKILKALYSELTIGSILGFKGGTAANLFYNLPRFSVDLDFDILDENKFLAVSNTIESLIKDFGKIKEQYLKRFTIFFLLSYKEKSQNIKIEVNKRNFGSSYELKNYLGIAMKVMVKEDMLSNKMVALYEREAKANRDIYDIWFFLKNDWKINKEIIKLRTGLEFEEFINKCIKLIEDKNNRNILGGIGELLEEKQKHWVKKNLKSETIFLLKLLQG